MYLEKLELQGFKSFAKRTIFEFEKPKDHNSITVVVGPNGSGKSNVADAIRWVLGEQSMKMIRGKKSEDVIFSGSEKKARLGFAEVSLYLNNEDGAAPIDYSQLVITRRLYRDGQGEYLLNKNPVRLFDIQLLLAKCHFGQKSFSIIGQGMIDSVLLSTPMERKAFFDEAVGVKEFQIKRHQALNKLERSEDHLDQASLLLNELQPQLRSLTRQVKRLEKRESLQAQLREYQHEYYHRLWKGLTDTKVSQHTTIGDLQTHINALQADLEEKRKELDVIEKSTGRTQAFTDLQSQLTGKEQEKNRLIREITVIKGRLELDLEKQGQLDLAWLYRQEEEVSERIIEVQKELNQLKEDHSSVATMSKEATSHVSEIEDKVAALQDKIEKAKNDIAFAASKSPLQKVASRVKEMAKLFVKFTSQLQKASEQDIENLKEQAESLQSQLDDIGELIKVEMEQSQKEEQVSVSESKDLWQFEQDLQQFLSEQKRLVAESTQSQIKLQVLEEKMRLKERDIEQLQSELKRIQGDLSTKQAAQQGKKVDNKLQEQHEALQKDVDALDKEIAELAEKLKLFNQEAEAKQQRVFKLEREFQQTQSEVNKLLGRQHTIQVELARTETKLEDLEIEIKRELGETTLVHKRPDNTETDVETLPTDHLFSQIEKVKYQLDLIGGIDPETVDEYKQVKERHDFLEEQINDLDETIKKLESVIEELDATIAKQFAKAFHAINTQFERYFQILFGGGRAKLIKVMKEDEEKAKKEAEQNEEETPAEQVEEILEEKKKSRAAKFRKTDILGIDIYASPPGKKLSTISMLSGGERSLTSIALVAAIIHHNPSPFILMDEVDAALDEANSQRMANVIEDLRQLTQFLVITHNRTIMNIADRIYGVTMGNDGVSQILSVKLEDIDKHSTRL